MSSPPRDVGRIIRTWRGRIGLTQEALADALCVTFSTISRWENERVRPSRLAWKAMERLAAERGGPLQTDPEADPTLVDHEQTPPGLPTSAPAVARP